MASTAAGRGRLFWHEEGARPAFFRDRSTSFSIEHDGAPHELRVEFTAARPLVGIRLDPGQAAGTITVSAMQLLDAGGRVVRQWSFAPAGGS
jgi:hypothetical protein